MSAHGTFHWNELITSDVEAAKRFFADTLGWTYQDMAMPNGVYSVAIADERPAAGIMAKDLVPGLLTVPSHWFAYIAVDDIDQRLARVEKAGGKVLRPAFDIPGIGRIGIVNDPTGGAVGWITPA